MLSCEYALFAIPADKVQLANGKVESGAASGETQAGVQVAGRMVKYSYYIARISSFIASKMQSSVTKNLVFPSCGDIKILQLLVCTITCLAGVSAVQMLMCQDPAIQVAMLR